MKIIEKLLNSSHIIYPSNLKGNKLKQKVEDIFQQRNQGFVGKFVSQDEFEAYDKWTYITWYVPNFKRKTAYLKGKIIDSGEGTSMMLNTRPNPVISILPILIVIVGIITILAAKSYNEDNKTFILGLFIIAVGILFYLMGMFLRNRLRKNFKKSFNL
ncbi:hypothetical protein [Salinimicrobium sp. TH3]|uniref:hypothetical protein n=1 Tax=Salinimicrobium sp. TH3 TaxID=2997342 RepID=UPI002275754E|nr:hypothetical protein [Salinimicrobium sp. TH3]MCY2685741.1 hypothetical protein [Salinimicrobium sp. TH3]